jgi:hypothetical protein
MKTLKAGQIQWTSDVAEVLSQEIAELSHKYLVELDALKKTAPGSDAFIEHRAEAIVTLEWMQSKINDLLEEMEHFQETWPD